MNERIKKLRRHFDLTQQEFADRIGVKRNTIANYETGRNIPMDSVLELIVREFNVSKEWLLNGTGEMFSPSPSNGLDILAQEKSLTRRERILIERFVNLRPETRRQILDYIQEVAAALSDGNTPLNAPALDSLAEAEAAYEKTLDSARNMKVASASSTIEEEADDEKQA